ncbi:MAG TPA: molybdopterin-dependent oxidoreductase [Rhizomicrobium sp.]|nr:molybdopterin-dependent oxidoreductase [Rhizomicrobium sp.]
MKAYSMHAAGLVLGFSSALCSVSLHAFAADAPLSITGNVAHPLHLSLADLRGLPSTHIAVTQASGRGPVALDCTGVPLSALLERASLSLGTKNNAKLGHALLISADDGYTVALSLGEIDPDYGHVAPLIATDCAGKALAAPRLIVPGDIHAGRAVNGVVTIEVK